MKYSPNLIKTRYKLVPRTLVFIENGQEILLIEKKKKGTFGFNKLNGIGGHIEKGEEPFESAKREILEETGLVINNLDLVAIIFIEIGIDPGILMFVFKTQYSGGGLRESTEGNLMWLNKELIPQTKNIVEDLPFLMELSDKHKFGEPPTIGKYLYNNKGELRIVF